MSNIIEFKRCLCLIGLVILVLTISSCDPDSDEDGGWNLAPSEKTGIDPQVGTYHFDQPGCFEVRGNESGKYVLFASDCYNDQGITIDEGRFYHKHGQIGGTHCPTDGFAISGSFVTETRAEGIIKYAYDCQITATKSFIATLN